MDDGFTYVATWKGFVSVAIRRENSPLDCLLTLLIHQCLCPQNRRLAGEPNSHAGFVLDALEQAVHDRRPAKGAGLVHHSDRGSQYLSIKYVERLGEAGIEWIDWFNNRRLLEPIGNIPPAEAEANF